MFIKCLKVFIKFIQNDPSRDEGASVVPENCAVGNGPLVRSLVRSTALVCSLTRSAALPASLRSLARSLARSLVERCHRRNESRVSCTDLANDNASILTDSTHSTTMRLRQVVGANSTYASMIRVTVLSQRRLFHFLMRLVRVVSLLLSRTRR